VPNQVNRRDIERWLLDNGFKYEPKSGGHRYSTNGRIKVTLPGHGPQDLTKKVAGHIRRQLKGAGYDVPW
jgi:predicted RNA binding protein YcfA (HicA-like mRNA interferase family)